MTKFNKDSVPSDAIFAITENCNLFCRYCYCRLEDYRPVGPDISVCKALVDFLEAQANVRNKQPSIHFFGGEPLTAFNEVKETMLYGKNFKWSITTNGTLLTPDTYKWLVEHGLKSILFSIDGPEYVHDINRVYHAGDGSFSQLMKNLEYLIKEKEISKYGCRGTFNQDTAQHLAQSYKFLHTVGFGSCTVLPSHEGDWKKEDLEIVEDNLTEVAAWWIGEALSGRLHEIHQFSEGLRFLLSTSKASRPCGLGDRTIGCTPTGQFVPCHRFGTRKKYPQEWHLGNVFDGIDEENFVKSITWDHSKRHSVAGYDCNLCPANDQCTGSCIAANWDCAGMPDDVNARYAVPKSVCDFSMINFRVACLIYRILRDNNKFQEWLSKKGLKGGKLPYYDPRKRPEKDERCHECQVCYTAQSDKCKECQVCYTSQEKKCERCLECQVCYTTQS